MIELRTGTQQPTIRVGDRVRVNLEAGQITAITPEGDYVIRFDYGRNAVKPRSAIYLVQGAS